MIALSALMSAGTAFGGSITVVGNGSASSAPECATINVQVASLCYSTSKDAKNANAKLAQDLKIALEKFRANKTERVIATGGANIRQTERTYVDDSDGRGHNEILCRNKWRAGNTLTLRTKKLDSLADLQDEVLAIVDKADTADASKGQTTATISQPYFDIEPATRAKLRSQAQHAAVLDAKAQVEQFVKDCQLKNPTLDSVEPPVFRAVPQYEAAPVAADRAVGGTPTPISPDNITVRASWKFVLKYTGGSVCAVR